MKNAIKYSNLLQETGLTKEQAEAHLEILEEIVDFNLATKVDLKTEALALVNKINNLESNLLKEINGLDNKINGLDNKITGLDSKINSLEHKLVNKLGLIVTAGLAAMATIFKFFL